MTPQQEQQLLQSLYDRLFQAITYAPDGGSAAYDPATTVILFTKNEAINPADFQNQVTPMNPNGSLNAAQQYSNMVDALPVVTGSYVPSGLQLAKTYQQIVNNADTKATVDPAQKATYDAAYNFLNATTSIPNFQGPPTVTTGPSPIALAYSTNQKAYTTAVGGYQLAMNGYNLDNPQDQRSWQAVAPGLQLNIDQAWDNWVRQGKQNVEQAQNALASTINNIISSVIQDSQKAMAPAAWKQPGQSGGGPWMLSYALPGDWANPAGSSGATGFSLRSSYLHTESSSNFNSYGGGASWGGGLWSVGGSFNHTDGQTSSHMDANTVQIDAQMTLVQIMRPWFNPLLFRTKGWWLTGQPVNAVSNGAFLGNAGKMLPIVPVAYVVMSNVTIKADFSSEDKTHIESATSGKTSVGWGPFSISGSYAHSDSKDTFTSTFDGGTITVPGMQIVAWVCTITPASPDTAG